MKKNLAFILISAAFAAASCGEVPDPVVVPSEVRIEPVITRATEVNFKQGDRIGLTVTTAEGLYADNAALTYDGSAFAGDLKWYSDNSQDCSLKAFYPYAQGGFPSTFTVGADQSAGAGEYDLMLAAKSGVKPQEAPVTMAFRHQLSQVVIDVDNQSSIVIESITLTGLLPKVDLSEAADGTVEAVVDPSASKVDIVTEPVSPGTRYRAIVVPQTMAFGVSIKSTGGSVLQDFSEVTMKPGYTYTINATVTAEGVAFKLSGEIQAWENGGVLDPDDPDDPDDDDYIVYDGIRYDIVTLPDGKVWMADPLAKVPEGMTVSDDPADGKVWYPYWSDGTTATPIKDQAAIDTLGLLYSYEALLGAELTEDNFDKFEGARGICPEGWHIPTRDEWFALCGNSNSNKLLGESGNISDASVYLWDPSCGYATVSKFNDAGFNFVLSGCIANNKYNLPILDAGVCAVEEFFGRVRMTYIASSTANSFTNFFALMTTFTSANPYGKVTLSYASLGKVGVQVRCVKD